MRSNEEKIPEDSLKKEINSLYINNPSMNIRERIKQFSSSADRYHNMSVPPKKVIHNNKINIWELTPRIFIIGQIWKLGTDFFSHKNNIDDVKKYLFNFFKDNYLILTKGNKLHGYNGVFYIDDIGYDLEYINRICIAVTSWLDICEDHVVAIELNYDHTPVFAILCECLLLYRKHNRSIQNNIFFSNQVLKSKLDNHSTVSRYKTYYEDLRSKSASRTRNLNTLHQIIITGYPKIENMKNFRILLKINHKNTNICTIKEIDNIDIVYKDEYYLIFTNINILVSGDIGIYLYFISESTKMEMLHFAFNGLCYEQGLFRFRKHDIQTKYRYRFNEDFKLDIVFLESDKKNTCKIVYEEKDLVQGLKVLTEFNKKFYDHDLFEKYVDSGYNRIVSKFCSQMNYVSTKVKELLEILRSKGYENLINSSKPLQVSKINFKNVKKEIHEKRTVEKQIKNESINRESYYKDLSNKDIKKIDIISEESKKDTKKSRPLKKTFKKKEVCNNIKIDQKIVALRQLHWIPILNYEETIFEELEDYTVSIDNQKFENNFCMERVDDKFLLEEEKGTASIIDPKKLFLISLSLKHLIKKKITPENVYEKLKTDSKNIYIQDLLNLEKMFPTYEEAYLLSSYEFERLNESEREMLAYSKLVEVKKIVEIFIFERKFFDEIFIFEDVLKKFMHSFSMIIASKSLRIILKSMLVIGNMINDEYSSRKRKFKGFKISGIYTFLDYKGHSDYTLTDFLLDNIKNKKIFEEFEEEMKFIDILKKEKLNRLKEKINYFIEEYLAKLDVYYTLESDKDLFSKFFIFVSEKLETIKNKYKECNNQATIIKRLFGEEENGNINDILICISELNNRIKQYKV